MAFGLPILKLLQAAIEVIERTWIIHKARAMNDAHHAIHKALMERSSEEEDDDDAGEESRNASSMPQGTSTLQDRVCVKAAPSFLKKRVMVNWQSLLSLSSSAHYDDDDNKMEMENDDVLLRAYVARRRHGVEEEEDAGGEKEDGERKGRIVSEEVLDHILQGGLLQSLYVELMDMMIAPYDPLRIRA